MTMTLAQQYRECEGDTYKNFVEKNAIAEGWKSFPKIGWYCHTIIFRDESVLILSFKDGEEGLHLFTGLPYRVSEE